jgi:hypothetical protein
MAKTPATTRILNPTSPTSRATTSHRVARLQPPKPEPAQPPRDREPPGHKPRDPPHGRPIGRIIRTIPSSHVDEVPRPGGARRFTTGALLGAPRAVATSNSEALATFAAAQSAFEAEDFSKARALFEQAQAYGMEGPAIHYNIGAASYLAATCRARSASSARSRTRRRWPRWRTTTWDWWRYSDAMIARRVTGSRARCRNRPIIASRARVAPARGTAGAARAGIVELLHARWHRLRRQRRAAFELDRQRRHRDADS